MEDQDGWRRSGVDAVQELERLTSVTQALVDLRRVNPSERGGHEAHTRLARAGETRVASTDRPASPAKPVATSGKSAPVAKADPKPSKEGVKGTTVVPPASDPLATSSNPALGPVLFAGLPSAAPVFIPSAPAEPTTSVGTASPAPTGTGAPAATATSGASLAVARDGFAKMLKRFQEDSELNIPVELDKMVNGERFKYSMTGMFTQYLRIWATEQKDPSIKASPEFLENVKTWEQSVEASFAKYKTAKEEAKKAGKSEPDGKVYEECQFAIARANTLLQTQLNGEIERMGGDAKIATEQEALMLLQAEAQRQNGGQAPGKTGEAVQFVRPRQAFEVTPARVAALLSEYQQYLPISIGADGSVATDKDKLAAMDPRALRTLEPFTTGVDMIERLDRLNLNFEMFDIYGDNRGVGEEAIKHSYRLLQARLGDLSRLKEKEPRRMDEKRYGQEVSVAFNDYFKAMFEQMQRTDNLKTWGKVTEVPRNPDGETKVVKPLDQYEVGSAQIREMILKYKDLLPVTVGADGAPSLADGRTMTQDYVRRNKDLLFLLDSFERMDNLNFFYDSLDRNGDGGLSEMVVRRAYNNLDVELRRADLEREKSGINDTEYKRRVEGAFSNFGRVFHDQHNRADDVKKQLAGSVAPRRPGVWDYISMAANIILPFIGAPRR